ncbi:MAG: Beta-barrel assembly-enhancing protease [Alphaproteobacteria bacterium MarineAlpha5_Bin9]|nr:MAG: Beta-barrel assembly-enhancing protease [Alphaproteobacteria bacterium MarineAlpha5_Bin9]
MLKKINSSEALVGIIAHEIGHIRNFHHTKRKQSLDNLKQTNQIGNLISITSSILLKNPDLLVQTALTNKTGIENYYSTYSKDQEKEADLFAIQRLNKLNISTDYLIKFLKFLNIESIKKGRTKDSNFFSTHPSYEERLNSFKTLSTSNNNLEEKYNTKLFSIKAKLYGYTENNFDNIVFSENDLNYAKAIQLSQEGKLLDSLRKINNLIKIKNDNPYILETKADILYNHGYLEEAKIFYTKSLNIDNTNIYAKKRLFEIDYENINNENSIHIENEYHDLIFNYFNDKDFYLKWYKIYAKNDKKDRMYFISGILNLINKKKDNAINDLETVNKISNDKNLINKSKILLKKIKNG